MDKKKCGVGGVCAIGVVFLLICTIWYFFFSPQGEIKISEKVKGNKNVIVNTAHREVSLVHIEHMENLGNKVNDLEDNMNKHLVIKYGLLLMLFIVIGGYVGQRCKNMPQKVKEKMEKRTQEERIETHEDALIEMGYLKPKKKKKKKMTKNDNDVKTKKKVKIEKTESDSEEETEIT